MLAGKAAEPCGQLATGSDTGKSRDFIANKVGLGVGTVHRTIEASVPNGTVETTATIP
jgi:hypothetical protein